MGLKSAVERPVSTVDAGRGGAAPPASPGLLMAARGWDRTRARRCHGRRGSRPRSLPRADATYLGHGQIRGVDAMAAGSGITCGMRWGYFRMERRRVLQPTVDTHRVSLRENDSCRCQGTVRSGALPSFARQVSVDFFKSLPLFFNTASGRALRPAGRHPFGQCCERGHGVQHRYLAEHQRGPAPSTTARPSSSGPSLRGHRDRWARPRIMLSSTGAESQNMKK